MSKQSHVMVDLENMNKMLENYSRNYLDCQSGEKETEQGIASR